MEKETHTRLDWIFFSLSSCLVPVLTVFITLAVHHPDYIFLFNCHNCFTVLGADGNVLVHTENQASDVQQDERKARRFEHDGSPPALGLRTNSSLVSAAFSGDQTQRFCQTCVAIPAQNENTPVSFLRRPKKKNKKKTPERFEEASGREVEHIDQTTRRTLLAAHWRASHPFSCSQIIIKQQNGDGS